MTVPIEVESRLSLREKKPSISSRAFSPMAEAREPRLSRSCWMPLSRDFSSTAPISPLPSAAILA